MPTDWPMLLSWITFSGTPSWCRSETPVALRLWLVYLPLTPPSKHICVLSVFLCRWWLCRYVWKCQSVRWDRKDTLLNVSDICGPREGLIYFSHINLTTHLLPHRWFSLPLGVSPCHIPHILGYTSSSLVTATCVSTYDDSVWTRQWKCSTHVTSFWSTCSMPTLLQVFAHISILKTQLPTLNTSRAYIGSKTLQS